jgi:hypothetical protein
LPAIPAAIVKPGYRPQSSDTSIDADVLLFGLLRQLSPERKAVRVQRLDRAIRQLSPVKFVIEDPIGLALDIAARLEALEIPYYVGGSLASSLWGEPRYSEDLDLVIEADSRWIQRLVDGFNADFYLSETAIAEAFDRKGSSFNLISLASAEKIDLFVMWPDPFSRSKLDRRIQYPVSGGMLWLATAEDMVLQKLLWRRGNESEKQWRDVLGILKVQGDRLDFDYLESWAVQLDLVEDLVGVLSQAGL